MDSFLISAGVYIFVFIIAIAFIRWAFDIGEFLKNQKQIIELLKNKK